LRSTWMQELDKLLQFFGALFATPFLLLIWQTDSIKELWEAVFQI